MSILRVRSDLERVRLGDYALPLGLEPVDPRPPRQGYTLTYNPAQDDEPDTYTFHIVVSHERLRPLLQRAFTLLPAQVSPIIEIDSYDAYRTVDVYIGREDEPVSISEFLETWEDFEPVFLEDGAVGAGANSEEPFIEVFLDQWKGLSIHVPPDLRQPVEALLSQLHIEPVEETWPAADPTHPHDATIRPVLDTSEETLPTLDDVILELRRRWRLELNVDPDRNVDDGGRELGMTLWYATLLVHDDLNDRSAFMTVWASAKSLSELEGLIEAALQDYPEWSSFECYSVCRVAYDDRPDELDHLKPRRSKPEVHLVRLHGDEEPPTEPTDA